MERENLMRCLYAVRDHYAALEDAKDDCNNQVDAELSLLVSESERRITAEDKKAIKKLGKAMATDKQSQLESEVQAIVNLIDSKTNGAFQLKLFTSPIQKLKESLGPGESITIESGGKSATLAN